MNKKYSILLNEGFLSGVNEWLYRDDKTISYWLLPLIFKVLPLRKISSWIELHSTRFFTNYFKVRRYLLKNKNNHLILFLKSLGAANTYKVIKNNAKKLKDTKITVIIIDGHGYGYGLKKRFKMWGFPMGMKVYNFYQRNKFPKGASFTGAAINRNVSIFTRDHWTIISNKYVLAKIKSILKGIQT